MLHDDSSASRNGKDDVIRSPSPHSNEFLASEHAKEETSSIAPINNNNIIPQATTSLQKETEMSNNPPSELRQNLFLVFITLTQLVQMIPLGAGINSGLAIGEALGAINIESVWIVASYPLTQGSFVLIGKLCFLFLSRTSPPAPSSLFCAFFFFFKPAKNVEFGP